MRKSAINLIVSFSISLLSIFILSNTIISKAAFSDVPSSHPYFKAINYVQKKGIVNGYPDGTFQPDRILNRAEFTKIIMESRFDENTINSCIKRNGFYEKAIFKDFDPGVWFEKYVCVAKNKKIISGYPDGTFQPIKSIIFAEAAKIAIQSYGLKTTPKEPWFAPYVDKFENIGAIPDSIANKEKKIDRAITEITRGEMADIIYRLRTVNDTIISDDGKFKLKIPERSLTGNLSKKDITIKRITNNKQTIKEINGAPMLFYKLEPSGTSFKEPVTFTISTPTIANTIPMVFLVSGDSFNIIDEPIIDIDQNTNTAFLTASIMHFSEIAIAYTEYLDVSKVKISPSGNQNAKNTFQANVDIKFSETPPSFIRQSNGSTISIMSDWTLDGVFVEVVPDSLETYFKKIDTQKKTANTNIYSFSKEFDCSIYGSKTTSIEYQGTLNYKYIIGDKLFSTEAIVRSQSNKFNCEGLDPTALQYELWRRFALKYINELRASYDIAPLRINKKLNAIAEIHAKDMAINIGSLSHTGSLGEESFTRIKDGKVINIEKNSYQQLPTPSNIDRSAENLGKRNISFYDDNVETAIKDQHDWFMSTPSVGVSHRTTMLSSNVAFSEIGIGMYLDDKGILWIVENFISYK